MLYSRRRHNVDTSAWWILRKTWSRGVSLPKWIIWTRRLLQVLVCPPRIFWFKKYCLCTDYCSLTFGKFKFIVQCACCRKEKCVCVCVCVCVRARACVRACVCVCVCGNTVTQQIHWCAAQVCANPHSEHNIYVPRTLKIPCVPFNNWTCRPYQ